MNEYNQIQQENKTHGFLKKFPSAKAFQNGLRKFGGFMAGMIMPIIGVIIAWGFFTAIILAAKTIIMEKNGILQQDWTSEHSKQYLWNMDYIIGWGISSVIPILIGFFAGKQINGRKGAIIGVISAIGIIGGSYSPLFNQIMVLITRDSSLENASPPVMILGVMIASPIWALVFKHLEKLWTNKIPSGFEMLINNISIGLFGLAILFLNFWTLSNVAAVLQSIFYIIIKGLNDYKLLWLMPVFIETEKVLFLNNAVNHGILGPLGYQEVEAFSKSALFYLDPNPGTGMGLLLAYFFFGNHNEKAQATSAMPVHFVGGIHEVTYPFVLTKPINLLWMIAGGTFAAVIYQLMGVGGVFTPSPGSIIMNYLALKPEPMNYVGLSIAIFGSLLITCLLTSLTLVFEKISKGERIYFNPIIAYKVSLANRWKNILDIKTINKANEISSIEYKNGKSLGNYNWEFVKYDDGLEFNYILNNEKDAIEKFWYLWLTKEEYKILKKSIHDFNSKKSENIFNDIIENSKNKKDNSKRYLLKFLKKGLYKIIKVRPSDPIIENIEYKNYDFLVKFRKISFKPFKDKNGQEKTKKDLIQKMWFLNKEEHIIDLEENEIKEVKTNIDKNIDSSKLEILKNAKKIIFACEAGMGSSAMGAGLIRKMLKEENINDILVVNFAIKDLPDNSSVIICQNTFKELVQSKFPNAYVYTINQFLKKSEYFNFINEIKESRK